MAETLITVTSTTVTHDETAGLQNSVATPSPAGDADDNDVLFSSIPIVFSTRLGQLTTNTAIGAAGSPGNVVTFSPTGSLGNIALTDVNGEPLDGDDSGLDTTDGEDILLYTDTNDNIVLGKTADGTLVFAIYLEETGGSPPTGGKFWVVQYDGIYHDGADSLLDGDGNNHDAAASLLNKVYVTAFEAQDFSFANAPSGSNLFMMFGDTSQAILVTGEAPANQSDGENISSGSTVSSSQGGGPTTLGTDGQQIKAQKALVVSFVAGANSDYIAGPNPGNNPGQPLSPTEANIESNIDFDDYFLARGAEITISQMNPTNASATVELAAYLTADDPGTDYIDDNPLVQGDAAINIDSVQVIRGGVNVVGTAGVSVNLSGSGAVITGVKNGDIISYSTDADHNRVLIRNDQPTSGAGSNVSFDLGGFRLTEVSGDTDEVGSKVFLEDDGPSVTTGTNPGALIVDETTLGTDASGSFAGLFNASFGTDGPKDVDNNNVADADAVTYALGIGAGGPNSGLVDTATGNAVFLFATGGGTTITGKAGTDLANAATGPTVFVITVNANTGAVTLDQQRAVVHTPDTGPDQSKTLADDIITLTATATDGDLDTASKTENVGDRFTFKDDAPTAGTNTAVQLDDETAQTTRAGANPGGAGDATGTSATATGTLSHAFGADGAGTVLLTSATLPASGGFSQTLSADSKTLTISQLQNGVSVDVVKIEVTNSATGAYTVTHLNQVFHPTPGATEEDVTFTVNYQVTDKDGDTANSSVNVLVDDDTPTVAAGTNPTALTVDETNLATNASGSFAGLFNPSFGADGQASTGALAYALGIGTGGPNSGLVDTATGNPVFLFLSGGGTTLTGKAGTDLASAAAGPTVFVISVDAATGLVALDQQRAVVHTPDTGPDQSVTLADDVITLTATAKDGDLDTASRTENVGDRFTFKDDAPAITVNDATGTYSAGAQGTWTDASGADGFKSLNLTLDSFTIGTTTTDPNPNISIGTVTAPNGSGNYVFTGSITGDFTDDGISNNQTLDFTLTFDPGADTFDFQIETPTGTTTTFDTSEGTLKAGGPDAVRTLLFGGSPPTEAGNDDLVFFAAKATAVPANSDATVNSILDLVKIGEPDLTEQQIENLLPLPNLIASSQMNVSTAGIGVDSNNLTGADEGTGTGFFAGTSITANDQSFIVNPETVVDQVTVYISSTVGGYQPDDATHPEALYYTIYYTDGTTSSAPQKVNSDDLTHVANNDSNFIKEVRGGDYFVIDGGTKQIDAVQLTMGLGQVKIPLIGFSVEESFDPQPLSIDFTATLLDGDNDSSQSSFTVDLDLM